MLPPLISLAGATWDVLPDGIHHSTLQEISNIFAYNDHRRKLFSGLLRAAKSLKDANCSTLLLDGSFISSKPMPGDIDCCWELSGVSMENLDPVFMDWSNERFNQKEKYYSEFFPASCIEMGSGLPFYEFFQQERSSGKKKGIVLINLSNEKF